MSDSKLPVYKIYTHKQKRTIFLHFHRDRIVRNPIQPTSESPHSLNADDVADDSMHVFVL